MRPNKVEIAVQCSPDVLVLVIQFTISFLYLKKENVEIYLYQLSFIKLWSQHKKKFVTAISENRTHWMSTLDQLNSANLPRSVGKRIGFNGMSTCLSLFYAESRGRQPPARRPYPTIRVIFVRPAVLHWVDITLHYNWLTVRRIFKIKISVRIHNWLRQKIYKLLSGKSSWQMRNWLYHYLEVHMVVNNFFSKWNTESFKIKLFWHLNCELMLN